MSLLHMNISQVHPNQTQNHSHNHPHHHHHHHHGGGAHFERYTQQQEQFGHRPNLTFVNDTMTTLLQEKPRIALSQSLVNPNSNPDTNPNPNQGHSQVHSHFQLSGSKITSENFTLDLEELKTMASSTVKSFLKQVQGKVQEVFSETEYVQMNSSGFGSRNMSNLTLTTTTTMSMFTTELPHSAYSYRSGQPQSLTGPGSVSNGVQVMPMPGELEEQFAPVPYQKLMYSVIVPIMLLCCILSSIVNLIIVLSVRWCRKPMSPTLYFSISLALADAFASFVLGAGLVINSLLPVVFGISFQETCFPLALEVFRLGGVLAAVLHLLALAINHWMGIVRPLQYEATMTRGTALRIIFMSWICPIILFLLYFSSIPDQGFRSPYCSNTRFMTQKTFRVIFASFFFGSLALMIFIYWHIAISVRNHLHYRLKYQSCQQLRRNVKAVVTTVLILGTYTVGWMPAILWYVIVCDDCVYTKDNVPKGVLVPINVVINTLLIMKAFVDPIIYAARMADIQTALKKMRYDLIMYLFGSCIPPRSPPTDQLELGSVRFTKSFRMSSRGSSSRSNV